MKYLIYILAIILLPAFLHGQENLVFEGQVTDAVTHDPLPESHVYISCQHSGTVTNSKGNYQIEIPSCCMTQCLIVSYMGYEKYIIPIHEIAQHEFDIELQYGVLALAELVITQDQYWIIFKPKFDPYRPEPSEELIVNDRLNEARPKDKLKDLISMR
jgi:hypothetical protein